MTHTQKQNIGYIGGIASLAAPIIACGLLLTPPPAHASLDGAWHQQDSADRREYNAEQAFCWNLRKSSQWGWFNGINAHVTYAVGPGQMVYRVYDHLNRGYTPERVECIATFAKGYLNREWTDNWGNRILYRNESGSLVLYLKPRDQSRVRREVKAGPLHASLADVKEHCKKERWQRPETVHECEAYINVGL